MQSTPAGSSSVSLNSVEILLRIRRCQGHDMCWNSVFPLSPLSAVSTWSSHTRVRAHTRTPAHLHTGAEAPGRAPGCAVGQPAFCARCLARSAGRFAGADGRPGRGPSCGLSPHGSARGVVRSPQLEDALGRDETVAGRAGRPGRPGCWPESRVRSH